MSELLFKRVTELCEMKGLSKRKLQEEMGMSIGSLSKWKTSTPNPTLLKKVADYFGVTTEYLEGKSQYMNQDHMIKCWQEKYGDGNTIPDLMLSDGTIVEFMYSKSEGVTVKKLDNQPTDYVYIDPETREIAEKIMNDDQLKYIMAYLTHAPKNKIDAIYNMVKAMDEK